MTSNQAKAGNSHTEARSFIAALPSLPSHIRYLDEYQDLSERARTPPRS